MEYNEFIKTKEFANKPSGFKISEDKLNPSLFDWQKKVVQWAIHKGKSALFEGCGLGKTIQSLSWSNQIYIKEKEPILILAPLAVSKQTVKEGEKFGIDVNLCQNKQDVKNGINITNYQKLHKFDPSIFCGVVIDESSILKNFTSKTRNDIIESFKNTPYKLACTATPSPNDYMELGNHAEFLNVMTRSEMLAMFFINDTANTGTWRLKGHVKDNIFWKWLSSWAIMMENPSDLGYDDNNFELPEIEYHEHIIPTKSKAKKGFFFVEEASTLNERRQIRKETIGIRCKKASDIINATNDIWLVWCGLNDEGKILTKNINDSVEVAGRHSDDIKSKRMLDFADGKIKRLVSKTKIAGFGMNFQVCNKAFFVGLNDSWESIYQAVRRIWRFGQTKKVDIHIVIESREGKVLKNIKRKDEDARKMIENMIVHTRELTKKEIHKTTKESTNYYPQIEMEIPKWL